jgi:uncharacterized membrane protein YgdD (TMEM256/DUF423 family)
MNRGFFGLGAVLALLAVAFGAFGAHVLEPRIGADRLATFETAARYQMYHALALLLVALAFDRLAAGPALWSGRLFVAGMLFFCGGLYGLALGAPRWFGAVAPVGGLCFMTGWLLLAVAALRA